MKKLILMTAVVLSVAGVAHARGPGGGMGGGGMGGGSAQGQMQPSGNGQGKQEQKQIQQRHQYQYQHQQRVQQSGMGGAATPQGPTFQNQERVRENIQTPGADVAR